MSGIRVRISPVRVAEAEHDSGPSPAVAATT